MTARAAAGLRNEIGKLEDRKRPIDQAIGILRRQLADLEGTPAGRNGNVSKKAPAKGKRRRGRRSAEDLKEYATAIADFITAGKDKGRTGREIRAKFPVPAGTTIKAFVMKHAGEKISTRGQKAGMKYFNMKG
jgi:hypothetical protein